MRVLIAPDRFAGTLTAGQAAGAIAEGWARSAPHDPLDLCPVSDGGPGFVDTLHAGLGGRLEAVTVSGPLENPVPATVLLTGSTAYVEAAQACGLHLLPAQRRDPARASTAGVGQLLTAALATGATEIVVGVGGTATNDGGAGMLAALGAGDPALLGRGGAALADLPAEALDRLRDVRERFAGVRLVAATSVDVPLLGFHGASASHAARKGASGQQAQQLEAALGRYAQVAQQSLGLAGADLLSAGAPRRLPSAPGAGAGGGLGFGLLLLGAERVPGPTAVLDAVRFDERLVTADGLAADLVVTGEGTFGWQSLRGRVVSTVAERALSVGVPVVVVAGQVEVGRRESLSVGIESTYAVAETTAQVEAALADPSGTLAARAQRVARTWSR